MAFSCGLQGRNTNGSSTEGAIRKCGYHCNTTHPLVILSWSVEAFCQIQSCSRSLCVFLPLSCLLNSLKPVTALQQDEWNSYRYQTCQITNPSLLFGSAKCMQFITEKQMDVKCTKSWTDKSPLTLIMTFTMAPYTLIRKKHYDHWQVK